MTIYEKLLYVEKVGIVFPVLFHDERVRQEREEGEGNRPSRRVQRARGPEVVSVQNQSKSLEGWLALDLSKRSNRFVLKPLTRVLASQSPARTSLASLLTSFVNLLVSSLSTSSTSHDLTLLLKALQYPCFIPHLVQEGRASTPPSPRPQPYSSPRSRHK